MIAELNGIVGGPCDGNVLVLDVHGVGYRVDIPTRFAQTLPPCGEPLRVFIEPYIREDQFRLYGFPNEAERRWFSLLMRVPAVGAKLALAILGQFEGAQLGAFIMGNDAAALAQAPGVGKKLAMRIIQELRDKLPDDYIAQAIQTPTVQGDGGADARHAMTTDAISALRNLGYAPQDAQRMVQTVYARDPAVSSITELIRRSLQELGR